uniref:Alpha-2-macroglobulin n=1 Tax=Piliocolobus tephrosceles TaxID=591936 RepID=A0A8C9GRN1_9PRIM
MGNQLPQPVLILLFLLLPSDASAAAEPQYLVLVPSHLYTGVPEKACVILNHLNETVALKVTLRYEMQNNPLFTDLVTKRNYFYCSSFMVKLPSSWVVIAVEVKGATLHFTKSKSIHITTAENLVFVQTDKSIYKPGQTGMRNQMSKGNFGRGEELLSYFILQSWEFGHLPFYSKVYISIDPMKNRIFQKQSLKLQGGLIQLSFPLSVEPILGSYKIMLQKESGKKIERSFEVNEYVLPKFEVQVKMPKVIGFLDEEFVVTTCALYTYGEPVPGMVTLSVCRKYSLYCFSCHNTHSRSICEEFSQQTDTEGCFTQLIKTKIFQLRRKGYDMTIHVEAKVKEKGTGLELTGHGSCEITNTLSILRFTKVDSHYRSGLPWYGQVLLVNENHQPITNKTVDVHVNTRYYFSATTDELGLVNISMDTTNYVSPFLTVSVKYKESNNSFDNWWLAEFHKQTSHTAKHFFSPSKSYIHLKPTIGTLTCGQTQEIQVHYILNKEILKDEKELTFYYLVRIRATVALSNCLFLLQLKGVFSFSFRVESDSAPRAHLLVYTVLPNGEIVADADKLEIENCFANKVTLRFSSAQSLPASNTHLKVTATPLSLCALRAVDQSVLLMKPEAELSPQSVSPTPALEIMKCSHDKIIFGRPGLRGLPLGEIMYPMVEEEPQILQVEEIVRKYFPETWIWDLVVVNSSGVKDLVMQVPDTITEWKASAFCLSGTTGFGLSPVVSLQAFQPFFLELTLPYSVVRGEAFTLKATVFNYLSICIRVIVQLEVSSAFLAVPTEKNEESHCVCRNGRKTVSWTVTPKSLGKVNFTATAEAVHSQEVCDNKLTDIPPLVQKDTVVKPLLVEVCEFTLCESQNTGVPEKVSLNVPSNVVEGSPRATYSVLGDILGSVVQNLQNLLQMPYGCGEQNMVLFVPNIYVLNYLNETRQLTEKIKAKATNYLISGYQRQLNYKHRDGSYSTFGDNDGSSQGNTWLTAFVLKSFAQAQSYIFVENSHIRDALTWLSRRQKADGCFEGSGSLLNNAIKGGVNDELTLSAYITIALLEMPLPATHAVVRSALSCLETAWSSTSEDQGSLVYTKALLAYAFALAGNKVKRRELLESLNREAVKEEDSIHWQRPGKLQEAKTLYSQPRAPSAEVEMTSYVLLTYLTVQPAPSSEDLSVASRIVKWITKQQNPQGGFSSTQDTVVALQALSKYGTATFSKSEKAALVTVKSSHTFSKDFQVDDGNRLVLQEVRLPEVPGEYSTTVSGSGCVYLQTCLRYNVLPKKEGKVPFALQVNTLPTNCDGVDAHRKFQIHINISYTGDRPSSNMVIVDVKMVSGFIPMKPSVKQVIPRSPTNSKRTEVSINHVLIYFEKLTHQALNFSFFVEQDIQIKNLKPATVKAYDYYETDEFTFEEYSAPCSAGKVLMIQSNAN